MHVLHAIDDKSVTVIINFKHLHEMHKKSHILAVHEYKAQYTYVSLMQ